MAKLIWGKVGQLSFANDSEYYQALGSLCRDESYHITFETNSDTASWGDAFRIKCLEQNKYTPDAFVKAMRNARRINCNDYVQNLYKQHNFDFDVQNKVLHGNFGKVKKTVPDKYQHDFEEGYKLNFSKSINEKSNNNLKSSNAKTEAKEKGAISCSTNIEKNNLICVKKGDIIIHRTLGEGTVLDSEGKYIRIRFNNGKELVFANPDAFNRGFLSK